MKKLLIASFVLLAFTGMGYAQTAPAQTTPKKAHKMHAKSSTAASDTTVHHHHKGVKHSK